MRPFRVQDTFKTRYFWSYYYLSGVIKCPICLSSLENPHFSTLGLVEDWVELRVCHTRSELVGRR